MPWRTGCACLYGNKLYEKTQFASPGNLRGWWDVRATTRCAQIRHDAAPRCWSSTAEFAAVYHAVVVFIPSLENRGIGTTKRSFGVCVALAASARRASRWLHGCRVGLSCCRGRTRPRTQTSCGGVASRAGALSSASRGQCQPSVITQLPAKPGEADAVSAAGQADGLLGTHRLGWMCGK